MKILHTSDWHLGKSLYDFSLLDDQRGFISWLLAYLEGHAVDLVLLAGDVYDRPVPSGAAVALYDYFLSRAVGEMGIPVVAVAGNHDSPGRLEFGSSLYEKSGYHIVGRLERDLRVAEFSDRHGPVRVTLLPYLHIADVRSLCPGAGVVTFDDAYRVALEHHRERLDPSVRSLLVAHGFFGALGAVGKELEILTSDSEIGVGGMDIASAAHFAGFDYVALGHLHAPQRCGETARYSGSPLKYSLSEEHQNKSVTVLDLGAKGEIGIETIPVPAERDVRTIKGTLDELMEPSFHENLAFDDYVFAEIDGPECAYPMQKLRTLFPNLLGLRFGAQMQEAGGQMPLASAAREVGRASTEELFLRFWLDSTGRDLPQGHLAVVREALAELEARGEEVGAV